MWNSSECQSSPVETRNRVIGAHPNSIVVLHSAGCLTKCGIALSQLSKFAWVPIHEEYNSRKTNSRNYGWHQSWFFGIFTDLLTRLHPRGKGGPEGALVWKTFKSLKLSSDRVRQTDIRWICMSSKRSKIWYYESFISVYEHSFRDKMSQFWFLRGVWRILKKNFERKTWPIFGSIFKNSHGPKIELFPLRRVYEGKNHVTRARCSRWNDRFSRTRTETDMDFLNVCHTKAPSGQKYSMTIKSI